MYFLGMFFVRVRSAKFGNVMHAKDRLARGINSLPAHTLFLSSLQKSTLHIHSVSTISTDLRRGKWRGDEAQSAGFRDPAGCVDTLCLMDPDLVGLLDNYSTVHTIFFGICGYFSEGGDEEVEKRIVAAIRAWVDIEDNQ